MDVVVLNSALLKILYDFRAVKNSCERIRTIFSIGLWKEYTCVEIDVGEERFKAQCLNLFLLIKKVLIQLAS